MSYKNKSKIKYMKVIGYLVADAVVPCLDGWKVYQRGDTTRKLGSLFLCVF